MAVAHFRQLLGASSTRVGYYGPHSTPTGTTKNTGSPSNLPVRRRLRLHTMATGLLLREMWSDAATGSHQFRNLPAGTYYVVAFDHTLQYSGVIETDVVLPAPPTP